MAKCVVLHTTSTPYDNKYKYHKNTQTTRVRHVWGLGDQLLESLEVRQKEGSY